MVTRVNSGSDLTLQSLLHYEYLSNSRSGDHNLWSSGQWGHYSLFPCSGLVRIVCIPVIVSNHIIFANHPFIVKLLVSSADNRLRYISITIYARYGVKTKTSSKQTTFFLLSLYKTTKSYDTTHKSTPNIPANMVCSLCFRSVLVTEYCYFSLFLTRSYYRCTFLLTTPWATVCFETATLTFQRVNVVLWKNIHPLHAYAWQ